MSVTACISHKEDVDGIISAVLINAAFNAKTIILVDYPNIISSLNRLSVSDDQIFISDSGLNRKNEVQFMDIAGKMASNGIKLVYVDKGLWVMSY